MKLSKGWSAYIFPKNNLRYLDMLKTKQELEVDVTIVTWEPDEYGFGDAS